MSILVTGATGYIGAHITARLLEDTRESLNLLVRARDQDEAWERLWRALQLHLTFSPFQEYLRSRVRIFLGDITAEGLGLAGDDYRALVDSTEAVIHCAAALNRRSERVCLNVNLRGTLAVLQLARRAHIAHGLRRFSHLSTVAVAGQRQDELVLEDEAIDWGRRDYDPYARTKKFCEHMLRELLPDVPLTIFRPSIVLGDSRYGETTQFDMVRAYAFLASLPVLPFRASDRLDIVPVDYVAKAVVTIHQKAEPQHDVYHLSSGSASETYGSLTTALAQQRHGRHTAFVPALERPFVAAAKALARQRGPGGRGAALMSAFLPYLTWNTAFDNTRVVSELGAAPEPFSRYGYDLLRFSQRNHFSYPYLPWPAAPGAACL